MSSNTTNSTKKPVDGQRQRRGDSTNQVNIIGRLVATPELRDTGSSKSVTIIRVATKAQESRRVPRRGSSWASSPASLATTSAMSPRLHRETTPESPAASH